MPTQFIRPGGTREQGFVLVGVLLIMLVLVLIGISATSSTNLELQLATAERLRREVFHAADSGVHPTPRLITMAREVAGDPPVPGFTFEDPAGIFYDEVMGFAAPAARINPNFSYRLGSHDIAVDIDHRGVVPMPGGGAEFAMGATGIGAGATGGIMVRYNITATADRDLQADGGTPARAAVMVRYRNVPGTAGGLQ